MAMSSRLARLSWKNPDSKKQNHRNNKTEKKPSQAMGVTGLLRQELTLEVLFPG